MIGLPQLGERVKVYPTPGRKVQNGARPLDSGGRFLAEDGAEVDWTMYHFEQYRCGDIMLHEPPKAKAEEKKPAAKYDFSAASEAHLKALKAESDSKKSDAKPAAPAQKGKE